MPIVTATEVAAKLGRDLTSAEQADVTQGVAAAVEVIESQLRRTVELGQFAEKKQPLLEGMSTASAASGWSSLGYGAARIHLTHRPVASLVSVVCRGANITAACLLDGDTVLVPTQEWCEVTYVGGDDPPSPLVKRMILKALTRELFLPAAVASGAYSSYSVEGASFDANAPAPDDSYPFNGSEMRALRGALGRLSFR